MEIFKIVTVSDMWSTEKLTRKVEGKLTEIADQGWEVKFISFGYNIWFVPTAFITLSANVDRLH